MNAPPLQSPAASVPSAPDIAQLLDEPSARPWWRRRTPWAAAAVVVVMVSAWAWWQSGQRAAAAPTYVTETVARGTLNLTVSADGTLQPTRSVNVGSELSGTVARVLVDVNDRVTKGQVLVELDTAKLRDQIARTRAALAAAVAGVAQSVATRQEAQASLSRLEEVRQLSGGKVPAPTEIDTARAAVERAQAAEASARAGVASARAQLSTDETNLAKASIRSPIDGVVLTRSVDPGNAVAASLQAVTLFTLAEDLRRLNLEVNVDETDVGLVLPGQKASFTVGAYLNRRFPATVTRVAYGSTKTDNVVTYTTRLEVANPDLTLRPGMTATATIQTAERSPSLLVPNTALRFTPSSAVPTNTGAQGSSLVSRLVPRPPVSTTRRTAQPAGNGRAPGASRQLWVLRDGAPVAVRVTAGATDGKLTEVSGPDLAEGEAVIVDQRSGAAR